MEENRNFESWHIKLVDKLNLIENLVQKLVNAPNSKEPMVLLDGVIHDLSRLTDNCDDLNVADAVSK